MSRKSRRGRRKGAAKPAAQVGVAQPRSQETAERQTVVAEAASGSELAEQYAYVYSDLKRIAILAGGFLALLVLLSFVIQ
jgi:hypothetical protein